MTKEQCIGLLKRYAEYDGIGIPNLAGCKEAMRMAAELLERPSLPSNLDEAAEEIVKDWNAYGNGEYKKLVKAGAEWMAGQGVSMEITPEVDWTDIDKFVYKNSGDNVIIQIRKINEKEK